jgi:hypothetical protein
MTIHQLEEHCSEAKLPLGLAGLRQQLMYQSLPDTLQLKI